MGSQSSVIDQIMLNDTDSRRRTRRRFLLTAVAGGAGVLAGCGAAASSESDPFESVTVEKETLVVTLSSSSRIDEVELRSPDGSPFLRRRPDASTTKVSLPLIETTYTGTPEHYRAGENTLIAYRDGDSVGRRAISLIPKVSITDMWLTDDTSFNPTVAVENTGTAPTFLTYLGFDNVPNPTPPPEKTTGIQGDGDTGVLLPPTTREIRSDSMPFAFRRLPSKADTLSCPGRISVRVTVNTVHDDTVTRRFPVRFGGDVENVLWLSHRCSNVTIQPGD